MYSEDQLSLNISTSAVSLPPKRRPISTQDRWTEKKLKAGKRKWSSGSQGTAKVRRSEYQTEEEVEHPATPSTTTQRPATPSTTTQRPATPSTTTQRPATPSTTTQRPATPSTTTQRPATPSTTTQRPATPSTTTQQPHADHKRRREKKNGEKKRREERRGEEKRREERRGEEKRREEHTGVDKQLIKTSSLFKFNPDIPDVQSPVVIQLKEKVFSKDSFSDLNLHPHLVATLNKVLHVTTMTSVQKQTIPVLQLGRDAVVRSQTGSGKTLAYAVPLVQSLQAVEPKIRRQDGVLALIIVPTRELAQQSFQTFQKLLKPFTWIVPGVLMGGEKRKAEKARLRKGINILVSTPGRLVDHIKHTLNMTFSSVRWLVLDEADRILDLGFEKDLTVILNSLNSSGPERQNILLSATITQSLSRLSSVCMKDPVTVHISDSTPSSDITPDASLASQSESFAVPEALKQLFVVVPSKLRLVCLSAFILDTWKANKVIVFVSSCEAVEFLLSLLTTVLCKPSANHTAPLSFLRLHGNMKQEERTEVFQEFSAAKTGVLLCTDVAARGLDLPLVNWIVQYDPPSSSVDYVHRVGRTARIGGRGSSLLFLTPAESGYISELANHNISLSEMKLMDILASLMQDEAYKGRGKYYSESSEVRERATVLQTELENAVHSSKTTVQAAKKALQAFLRAYTAYPSSLKHVFHIKNLHLGHAAKSFGLRDAPQNLTGPSSTRDHNHRRTKKNEQRSGRKLTSKQRVTSLLQSEFSSGLKPQKKKKKVLTGQEDEGME